MRAFKRFQEERQAHSSEGLIDEISHAVADLRAQLVERGWFGMEEPRDRGVSAREAVYGHSHQQDGDLAAMSHRFAQADRDDQQEQDWEAEL